MEDMTMLWNAILTLNSEIGKILTRFDKLEAKLDRWMEKH